MATQQNRKLEMLFTQRSKVVKDPMALRLNIMRQMEVRSFWNILEHSRPCITPHAPCDIPPGNMPTSNARACWMLICAGNLMT